MSAEVLPSIAIARVSMKDKKFNFAKYPWRRRTSQPDIYRRIPMKNLNFAFPSTRKGQNLTRKSRKSGAF
ncbi:MAG: hypothetical protein WC091_26325 [Sulfuricellaceae bacterium]